MRAYCLRCRQKVDMKIPISKSHTKNNRFSYIGTCNLCGQKVSVIRQEKS